MAIDHSNGNGAAHAPAAPDSGTPPRPISVDDRLQALETSQQDLLKKLVATKDFIHEKVIKKVNELCEVLAALDARVSALEAGDNTTREQVVAPAGIFASRKGVRKFKMLTADGQTLDQHTPYIRMVLARRGLSVLDFTNEIGISLRTAKYWMTGLRGPQSRELRLSLVRWLMDDPTATPDLFKAWASLPANITG